MSDDNKKTESKFLETYAEDMAEVIQNDSTGLVKKIIHEQEEKEKMKKIMSPDSARNRFYIITGAILATLAFFLFIFFLIRKEDNSVPVAPQFVPIIFNDKSFFIEIAGLDKDKITASVISEVKNSKLKTGGLEGIYLTRDKQIIGLREFLSTMKMNLKLPSPELASDNFMMGFANQHALPTGQAGRNFFFLLKVRSFADIFENMRAWEGKMFQDLHDFMGTPINSETSYLLEKSFEDGVVENKNARLLKDKNGSIIMIYVFADDTSVVVARNPETIAEIMRRLSSSRLGK